MHPTGEASGEDGRGYELADDEALARFAELKALLESSGATAMQATPATWRLLIESGWRGAPAVDIDGLAATRRIELHPDALEDAGHEHVAVLGVARRRGRDEPDPLGAEVAVAPAMAGSIPLQLVKANPAMGDGMAMKGVSYIQRVATVGGVAPAMPCAADSLGRKELVDYRADYIFWKAA